MIIESSLWHRFQKQITARVGARLWLCGYVIAFVPSASMLAQPPGTGRLQDRDGAWSRQRSWDPGGLRIHDEDVRFDSPRRVVARSLTSPTVTLHELTHRVPGRAVKEHERGAKAAAKGENENAIQYYKRAIAADPEFVTAINDLGVAYLHAGRIELAIEQFTKGTAVDPHAALPTVNLAIAYLRKGNFVDAEHTARRAVNLNRVDTYAPLVLGASLILDGRFTAEAEHSLRKAIHDHAMAKLWLALCLIRKGDVANAKEHLRTYIAQASSGPLNWAADLLKELESAGQADGTLTKGEN